MKNKLKLVAIAAAILSIATLNLKAEGNFVDNFNTIEKEPAKLEKFVSDFKLAVPYEGQFALYKFEYEPKVINDKSCLSLYDVAISLGKAIYWDGTNRLVIIDAEDDKVVLPIDKKAVYVDGKIYKTDIPATIDKKTGRTYLPLRTIGDVLGYNVKWNNKNKTAIFSKKDDDVKVNYTVLREVDEDSFDEYFKKVKDEAVEESDIKEDENVEHSHNDENLNHNHAIDDKNVKNVVVTEEEIKKAEIDNQAKFYLKLDDLREAMKEALVNKKETFSFLAPLEANVNTVVSELEKVIHENGKLYKNCVIKDLKLFKLFKFTK